MPEVRQLYQDGHSKWLSDAAVLWRYVPLRTLFYYLQGNIFIPSIEKLRQGDPFEGEFHFDTIWYNNSMLKAYGKEGCETIDKWLFERRCTEFEREHIKLNRGHLNTAARIFESHYFDFLRKSRYAWCWFNAEYESAAMWNTYGANGVVIATTVGKIRELFAPHKDFVFAKMHYTKLERGRPVDLNPENPEHARFILQPHFLKRIEYQSENEVRFVVVESEDHDSRHGGYVFTDLSPEYWIREIRLWPKLSCGEERSLLGSIQKIAPELSCCKSDLFIKAPESTKSIVDDIFANLAETAWEKGGDGIPAILKRL